MRETSEVIILLHVVAPEQGCGSVESDWLLHGQGDRTRRRSSSRSAGHRHGVSRSRRARVTCTSTAATACASTTAAACEYAARDSHEEHHHPEHGLPSASACRNAEEQDASQSRTTRGVPSDSGEPRMV